MSATKVFKGLLQYIRFQETVFEGHCVSVINYPADYNNAADGALKSHVLFPHYNQSCEYPLALFIHKYFALFRVESILYGRKKPD